MENITITKSDVEDILHSVKVTFIVNCVIAVFISILNSKTDIITQFFAAQSIGLTIVTIIQTAKTLYPPFKADYKKLYYFLPVAVLPASFIGINFLSHQTTLPKLIVLIGIITIPVMLIFHLRDNRLQAKRLLVEQQGKNTETENTLRANKLLLLQAQINPHFLFNTLANIKEYIISEPHKAQNLLTDYIFFLRQSLPSTQKAEGTVGDELALVNAYIAIQQTRFPHIRFIETVNETLENTPLPPLLIQPLLENAIAHGLAPKGHQGLITLLIEKRLDQLFIEVADSGVGFDDTTADEDSMALRNIRERLQLHHPLSRLTTSNNAQGHGAIVQIEIPLNF